MDYFNMSAVLYTTEMSYCKTRGLKRNFHPFRLFSVLLVGDTGVLGCIIGFAGWEEGMQPGQVFSPPGTHTIHSYLGTIQSLHSTWCLCIGTVWGSRNTGRWQTCKLHMESPENRGPLVTRLCWIQVLVGSMCPAQGLVLGWGRRQATDIL